MKIAIFIKIAPTYGILCVDTIGSPDRGILCVDKIESPGFRTTPVGANVGVNVGANVGANP